MEEYEFENKFVERKIIRRSGDSMQLSSSPSPWKPKFHLNFPGRIFGVIFFLALVLPSEQACSSLPISDASRVVTSASGNYSLSSVVILSCNSTGHYTPSGMPFSVCIGNNTWIPDSSTFICYDQCSSDLLLTDIVHSSENGGAKSFYDHNEVILLSCVEGATLRGSDMVTCIDGDLVMASQPECRADCPSPHLATPVRFYNDGDVASFSCSERNTQPPLATVTCRNGAWDPPFECFEKCEMPSIADGGLHLSFSPGQDGLYDHGDIIALSCSSPGHVINGVNITRCDNGSWIPSGSPSCQQEPTEGQSHKEITTQSESTTPEDMSTPIITNILSDTTEVVDPFIKEIDLGEETSEPLNPKEPTSQTELITEPFLSTTWDASEDLSASRTTMTVQDTTEVIDTFTEVIDLGEGTSEPLTTKELTNQTEQMTEPYLSTTSEASIDIKTPRTTKILPDTTEVIDTFTEIIDPGEGTSETLTTNELTRETEQITEPYISTTWEASEVLNAPRTTMTVSDTTEVVDTFTEVADLSEETSEPLTTKELINQTEIITGPFLSTTWEPSEELKASRTTMTVQDTTEVIDSSTVIIDFIVGTSEPLKAEELKSETDLISEPYVPTTWEASEDFRAPRTTMTVPHTTVVIDTFTEVIGNGEETFEPLTTKELTSITEQITEPYLSTTAEASEDINTPRSTKILPETTEVVETFTEVIGLSEETSEPLTTKELTSETERNTKPYLSTIWEASEDLNPPRTTMTVPDTTEVVDTLTEIIDFIDGKSESLTTKELTSQTEQMTEPYLSTTSETSIDIKTPRTTKILPDTTEVIDTFTEIIDPGEGTSETLTTNELTRETEQITEPYISTTWEASEVLNAPRTTMTVSDTTEVVDTFTEVADLGEETTEPLTTKELINQTEIITGPFLSTTWEPSEELKASRTTMTVQDTTEVIDSSTVIIDFIVGTSEPLKAEELKSETDLISEPYVSTTWEASEDFRAPRTTMTVPHTTVVVDTFTEVIGHGEETFEPLTTKELTSITEQITEPYLSTTIEASEDINTPRPTKILPETTEVVETFTEVIGISEETSEPLTTKELTSETERNTKPYLSTIWDASEDLNPPRTTMTVPDTTEVVDTLTEIIDFIDGKSESLTTKELTSQTEQMTEPYLSTTSETSIDIKTPRTTKILPDTTEVIDTFTEIIDPGEGTSETLTTNELTRETEQITEPYISTTWEASEVLNAPRTTMTVSDTTEVVDTFTEVADLSEETSEPLTTKELINQTEIITGPFLSTTWEPSEELKASRTTMTVQDTTEVIDSSTVIIDFIVGTSEPLKAEELKSETDLISEPYVSTTWEASEDFRAPRTTMTVPHTTVVIDTFTEVIGNGEETFEPLTTKELTSETEQITEPYLSTTTEASEDINTPRPTKILPETTEVVETFTEVIGLSEETSEPLTTKELTSETERNTKPYLSTIWEASEDLNPPRTTMTVPDTTEVVDTLTEIIDFIDGKSESLTNKELRSSTEHITEPYLSSTRETADDSRTPIMFNKELDTGTMASMITDGITTAQPLSEVPHLISVTSDGNTKSETNAITLSTVYETFSNVMTEMFSSELAIEHKSNTLPDTTERDATLTPNTLSGIETLTSAISVLDSSTSKPVTLVTPTYQEPATPKTTKLSIGTLTELVTEIVDVTLLSNTQDEIVSHRGSQRDEEAIVTETTSSRYPDATMTTEFEGTLEPELFSELQTTLTARTDSITSHRPTGQSSAVTMNVEKEINIRPTKETGEPAIEFSTDVVPQSLTTDFPTNGATSEKMVKSTEMTYSDIMTETELVTETSDRASRSTSPSDGTLELTTIDSGSVEHHSTQLTDMPDIDEAVSTATEGFIFDEFGETTEPGRSVGITDETGSVTQDKVTDQTNDIQIITDGKETVVTEMYTDVITTFMPKVTQTSRDSSAENGTIMPPAATEVTTRFEPVISDTTSIVEDITVPEIRRDLRTTEPTPYGTPPNTYGTTLRESIMTQYQSTMSETETEIRTDVVTYVTDQGLARSDVAGPRSDATDLGSSIISRTIEESPTQTTTKYITTGVPDLTEVETSTSIESETAIVDETTAPSGRETLAGEAEIVTEDKTTESTEATRNGVDTTESEHIEMYTDVMTSIVQEETSTAIRDSQAGRQTTTIPTPSTQEITSKEATAWISTNLGETTTSDFVTDLETIEYITDKTLAVSLKTLLTESIALESTRSDFAHFTDDTTATEEDEITIDQQLRTTVKKNLSEKATYPEVETHTELVESFVSEMINYTLGDDIISPDYTTETKFSTSMPLSIITATEITTAVQDLSLRSASTTADYIIFSTDETVESNTNISPAEATAKEHTVGSTTAEKLATDSKMAQETEWYTEIITSMMPEKPYDTDSTYDIITKDGPIIITRTTDQPSITDSHKDLSDVSVLSTTEGTSFIGRDVTTSFSHEKTKTATLHDTSSPVQNVSEVKETNDSLYTSMSTNEGTDIVSPTLPAAIDVSTEEEKSRITTTSPISTETKVSLGTEWYTETLTSVETDSDPITQVLPSSTIKSMPTEITYDLRSTEQYPASTSLKQGDITSPAVGTEPLDTLLTSERIPMIETKRATTKFPDPTREGTDTAFATDIVTDISTQTIMSGKSDGLSTLENIVIEVASDDTASLGTQSQTGNEFEETFTTSMLTEIVQEVTYIRNDTLGPRSQQEIITTPEDVKMATTDKSFEIPDTTLGEAVAFTELVTIVSNGTVEHTTEHMAGHTSTSRMTTDNKVIEDAEWYTDTIYTLTGSERTSDIFPTVDIMRATNRKFTLLSTENPSTVGATTEGGIALERQELRTPIVTKTVTDIIDIFTDMLVDTTETLHGDTSRTKLGTDEKEIEITDDITETLQTEMFTEGFTSILTNRTDLSSIPGGPISTGVPHEVISHNLLGNEDEISSTVRIEITEPVSDLGTEIVSTEYSSDFKPATSPPATRIITNSKYVSETMSDKTEQTIFFGTDLITDTYKTAEPLLPVEGTITDTTKQTTLIGTDLTTGTRDETTKAMVTDKVTLSDTVKQTTFFETDLITDTYETTETILPVEGTITDTTKQTNLIGTDLTTDTRDETTEAMVADEVTLSDTVEQTTFFETDLITDTYGKTETISPVDGTTSDSADQTFIRTDESTEPLVPDEGTKASVTEADSTEVKRTTEQMSTTSNIVEHHTETTQIPHTEAETIVITEFMTDILNWTVESRTSNIPPKADIGTERITPTTTVSYDLSDQTHTESRTDILLIEEDNRKPAISSTSLPFIDPSTTIAEFETVFVTMEVPDVRGAETSTSPTVYLSDTVTKEKEGIPSTVVPISDSLVIRPKTAKVTSQIKTTLMTKNLESDTMDLTTRGRLAVSTGSKERLEMISTDQPTEVSRLPVDSTDAILETELLTFSDVVDESLTTEGIGERQSSSTVPKQEAVFPQTERTTAKPVILHTVVSQPVSTEIIYHTSEITTVNMADGLDDTTKVKSTSKPSTLGITGIHPTSGVTKTTRAAYTAPSHSALLSTEVITTPYTPYDPTVDLNNGIGETKEWATPLMLHSTEKIPMVHSTDEMKDLTIQTLIPQTAVPSSAVPITVSHTTDLPVTTTTDGAETKWTTITIPQSTENVPVIPTTDEMQDLVEPSVNATVLDATSELSTPFPKTQTTAVAFSAVRNTDVHTTTLPYASTTERAKTDWATFTIPDSTEDIEVVPTTDEMQDLKVQTDIRETTPQFNTTLSEATSGVSTSLHKTQTTVFTSSAIPTTDSHTTTLPVSTTTESTASEFTTLTILLSTEDIAVFPTTDEMEDVTKRTSFQQRTSTANDRTSQVTSEISTPAPKTPTTTLQSSELQTDIYINTLPVSTVAEGPTTELITHTKVLSTEEIAVVPATTEIQDLIEQTEIQQTTTSVSGSVSQFSREVSTSSLKTTTTDIPSSAPLTTDIYTKVLPLITTETDKPVLQTTSTIVFSTEDIAVFPTTDEMEDVTKRTSFQQRTSTANDRTSQVTSEISTPAPKTPTTTLQSSELQTDIYINTLPVSTVAEGPTTELITHTKVLSTEEIAVVPATTEIQDLIEQTEIQQTTTSVSGSVSQFSREVSTSSLKTTTTDIPSSAPLTTDIYTKVLPLITTETDKPVLQTTSTIVFSTDDIAVVPTTDEIQDLIEQTEIQQTTPRVNVRTSQVLSEVSKSSPKTLTTAMPSSSLMTTDILTPEFSITTIETDNPMLRTTPTILLSTKDIAVVPTTDEIQDLIERTKLQQTTSSVRANLSHVTSVPLPISSPQTRKTAVISSVVSTTDSNTTTLPTSTTGTDKNTLLSLSSQMSSTDTSVPTIKVKTAQPTQSISEPASATMKAKCGVKCEGLNEVCIVSVDGDSCRCSDGHERVDDACIEVYTFKADVKIVMIKGKKASFIPDLNDPSSIKFKELVAEFCQAMEITYKTYIETTSSFYNCDVIAFRPGSIVVEYLVKFTSPDINEAFLTNETLVYLDENNMTFPREISLTSSLVEYEPANECLLNLSDCDPAAKCIDRGSTLFTCKCSSGYDDLYEKQLPGRYCSAIQPVPDSSIAIRIKVFIILGIVVIFIILIVLLALCITRLYRRIIGRRSDDFIAPSSKAGSKLLGYGYRQKNDVEGISYISQHSTLEKRGSLVEVHHAEEMTESPQSRTDTELIRTGVQPYECEEVLVSEEMDRELQSRMESIAKFLKRSAPLNNSSLRDRIDYSIMYIPEAPTIPLNERRRSAEQPTEEFLDSLPQTYL